MPAPAPAVPRRPVIGVIGAAEASPERVADARRLGHLIAERGWVVLTGGRPAGVMAAATAGAKEVAGGLTIGVLPDEGDGPVADGVDIAIRTGMGNARNAINVLSSDVVIACGVEGPGTASEVALALKSGRPVIFLSCSDAEIDYWQKFGPALVRGAADPERAVALAATLLAPRR